MNYNLIRCVFLFLMFSISLNGIVAQQTPYEHHRKYWYYKSRLNNDFLKVGRAAGNSIPFMQRGYTGQSFNSDVSSLKSGDATSMLGYYIGILATEYYLLINNNKSTDKIKHELFCAIEAINRLDFKAETGPTNQNANFGYLNGFFVRDDIPKAFVKDNYEHFNYYSNWDGNTLLNLGGNFLPDTWYSDRGFNSQFEKSMYAVESTWQSLEDDNTKTETSFISQDQVYNLLFGLAFVNKFVPETETDANNVFAYGSNETSLTKEARNIANRIIANVRDAKHVSGATCGNGIGWKIKNPFSCTPGNMMGTDAQAFAYPLAEIDCMFKNGISTNSGASVGLGVIPKICGPTSNQHHNAWSQTAGYTTWQAMASSPNYASGFPNLYIDNRVFVENLSAVCNCVYGRVEDKFVQEVVKILSQVPILSYFGAILGWTYQIINAVINTFVPGFIFNNTSTAINVNAYLPGSPLDHGPLARKVLHGGYYQQNPNNTIPYLLDVMDCKNIYYLGNGGYASEQWSADSRLDHPNRIGGDVNFRGEYNGIDFMLYHNLWYVKELQSGYSQNLSDLSDIYINNPSNINCTNVNAYETITSENTNITCNTETYWRAGKTIYFGAGTSITGQGSSAGGPNFHAYIQKFECATDLGAYKSANVSAADSYAEGAQYHHVNYPIELLANTINSNENDNLITELPPELDPIEEAMKQAYPNYSKELFVKPTVTKNEVRAYFTLDDDETAIMNVMDMQGKIIYSKNNVTKNDNGLLINIENEATGMYLLKFTSTKGISKTEKIIKE